MDSFIPKLCAEETLAFKDVKHKILFRKSITACLLLLFISLFRHNSEIT